MNDDPENKQNTLKSPQVPLATAVSECRMIVGREPASLFPMFNKKFQNEDKRRKIGIVLKEGINSATLLHRSKENF